MRKRATPPTIDRRIGVHDRLQFELKLEYAPEHPRGRYEVEAFVCVPASLNVTPETVPPEHLYADIHNYVRLKTPELSWAALEALPDSPLVRVVAEAKAVARGADPAHFRHECRLFGCIYRAAGRDFVARLVAAVAAGAPIEGGLVADLEAYLAGSGSVRERFRSCRAQVHEAGFTDSAQGAWRLCDEYLSLVTEQLLRRVIVALASAGGDSMPLRARLLDVILEEEAYRKACGYPSVLDPHTDNEAYIFRSGLLKKFTSSALFLQVHRHGARQHWQDVLFAVAAGIAMAFATVIAFWAQARYRQLGLQLFSILVLAYMFKDRIKEWSKGLFANFLEKHFFDHVIHIEDPEGGPLGTCREKIEYVPPKRLPADIKEARRLVSDPTARAAEEELVETIYHYHKVVTLDGARLHGRPEGVGVTDILRFHIARLLHEMDEPVQTVEWVDRETQSLTLIQVAKVYHVDVVLRFRGRRQEVPQISLMRLVLDRQGIKRIEHTDLPTALRAGRSTLSAPEGTIGREAGEAD